MKKTQKGVIVQVNSVIDVITNSSSELFICKANKTVETVEELLAEILHTSTDGLSYYVKPVVCIGDNLELFIDQHVGNGWGYHNYAPLKECFVGDIDELTNVVTTAGNVEPKQDWSERYNHRRGGKPFVEQQEDELATAKYQRDKREEFLRNNNVPKVLAKLKDFVLIESESDNSIPYESWDDINATFNGNNWHLG